MTHGLRRGKPGPRAAKPITPPYVENNYRIEVKITFMLIAYLVLLCELFWEFSIFHFSRPLVDIYWHPLLKSPNLRNRNSISVTFIRLFDEHFAHHFESHWRETWRHTGKRTVPQFSLGTPPPPPSLFGSLVQICKGHQSHSKKRGQV